MSLVKTKTVETIPSDSSIAVYGLDAKSKMGHLEVRYCLFTADKTNVRTGTVTLNATPIGSPISVLDDNSPDIGDTSDVTAGGSREDGKVKVVFHNASSSDYFVVYEVHEMSAGASVGGKPMLQITISGLPEGVTWKGLGNGVHNLEPRSYGRATGPDTETLNYTTPATGYNLYREVIKQDGGNSESWNHYQNTGGTPNKWTGGFKIQNNGGYFFQQKYWAAGTTPSYSLRSYYLLAYHRDYVLMYISNGSTYTRNSIYLTNDDMPVTGEVPAPSLKHTRPKALTNSLTLNMAGNYVTFTWQVLRDQQPKAFGNF